MRVATPAAIVVVVAALGVPPLTEAQEPVKSFNQINTRVSVGDTVWVTDTRDREVKGKILELHDASLTLDGGAGTTALQAGSVRLIEARKRDSKKNWIFIGLAAGAGAGWLFGRQAMGTDDTSRDEEIWVFVGLYAGIGAGVGAIVDALVPGRKVLVYRAPATGLAARLSLAPVITPRTKGVALSYSF